MNDINTQDKSNDENKSENESTVEESKEAQAVESKKSESTTEDKPKKKGSKAKVFSIIIILLLIIGGGAFAYWYLYSRFYVETEDAYVRANILNITPRTSGAVLSLHTDAPEHVKAGQLLLKLDDTDARLNFELAKANLSKAVQGYCRLQYSSNQLESAVKNASIQVRNTKREYERNSKLLRKGSITRKEVDLSRDNYHSAEASYKQALSALKASKSGLSPLALPKIGDHKYDSKSVLASKVANSTEVRLARISLVNAWLAQHRTNIYSPVSGQIAKRSVEVGEMVQAGSPVMSVVQTSSLWVKANFKETQLANLRIGQEAEVIIDALGKTAVLHGKVAGVEAGTGTAFSLIPSENATGNWIKIVQRVPVRIELDPKEVASVNIGVGYSATVKVDVHDTSGTSLAQVSTGHALFKTDIYKIDKLDSTGLEKQEAEIISTTLAETGGCH